MPNRTEPNIEGRNNTLFMYVSSTHQVFHMCWEYLNSILIHASQFHNTTVGYTTQFVILPNRREKKKYLSHHLSIWHFSCIFDRLRETMKFTLSESVHSSLESLICESEQKQTLLVPTPRNFYVCGIFINHTKIEHQSMTWALYTHIFNSQKSI